MFNTLIVDDERLARSELKRLLASYPQCNIIGEAANAEQALSIMAQQNVDLIFLDINMPHISGLELAEQLKPHIQCVFCTAYNSFALDAFALNAVDYLLKPVSPERLEKTIQRLNPISAFKQQHYLPLQHGILLKFGDINRIVRLAEISRFESIGNHVALYTPYGKSYLLSSLSKVEQKLDPAYFFKASRADILRLDAIEHLEEGCANGSLIAILQDKQQVEVSRRQGQRLKQLYSGL